MNQQKKSDQTKLNIFAQFAQKNPFISASLLSIGSVYVVYRSFQALKYLKNVNFFLQKDGLFLQKRYGANSWAVVTGATDGLGKEFAFKLARSQFNILLLGRSETKLTNVIEEIKAQAKDIKCETIVFDLKNSNQIDSLNLVLDKGLADKNISILINNAGVSCTESHEEIPEREILDMININCLAPALISKKVIPLLKKNKKSAIINVSSFTGVHPMPYNAVYSGTKAFLDNFSKSIAIENRGEIDVLSLTPHYVSTKMIKHQKVAFDTRTPQEVVEACFRDLGNRDRSFGHINHELLHIHANIVPENYLENKHKNFMKEVVEKIRAMKEAVARRSQRKTKI